MDMTRLEHGQVERAVFPDRHIDGVLGRLLAGATTPDGTGLMVSRIKSVRALRPVCRRRG